MTDPAALEPREPGAWCLAALLLAPLLLLSVCWVFTNPPAAAPDETDHFVKAVGNARGQIGVAAPEPPAGTAPVLERVLSTTRTYSIPADLDPVGLTCFAFYPDLTADCQDGPEPQRSSDVSSSVGAYPPFLYVPIGLVAGQMPSAVSGIVAGRLVVTVLSFLLLLLGVAHLLRWLGRPAALGVIAVWTPVESFVAASVSTSGLEFAAALTVACVVTVAALRPETVHRPGTHAVLAVGGVVLVLSRQLGVLAMAGLVVALLVLIGLPHVRKLLARHRPSAVLAVVAMGMATALVLWWERTYDKPALVGTPFRADAVLPFADRAGHVVDSAVALFGWLDTTVPPPVVGVWLALWAVVVVSAVVVAGRRAAAVVLAVVVGTVLLAFITYASAFYPIQADVQGRHFMPAFCLAVVLGGAVLARTLETRSRSALTRLTWIVALVVGTVHVVSLFFNGRRYAVGATGPVWFLPDAKWSPVLGWTPWVVLTLLASAALVVVVVRFGTASGAATRTGPVARRRVAA